MDPLVDKLIFTKKRHRKFKFLNILFKYLNILFF